MISHTLKFITPLLVLGGLSACDQSSRVGEAGGENLYSNNCAPCHGVNGEGDTLANAPNIAGLPDWYVERQFGYFTDGTRGAHVDDYDGMRMRPMARTVRNEDEMKAVVAYVSSLPAHPSDPAMMVAVDLETNAAMGDPAKGKNVYNGVCARCHGQNAEGNVADAKVEEQGPPLAHLQYFYFNRQIWKFKNGVRGYSEKDLAGRSMAQMSTALRDDETIANVYAYIQTLKNNN